MRQRLQLILSVLLLLSVTGYGQSSRNLAGRPKTPDGVPTQANPDIISYQGLLTTSTGAPATDGVYTLKFDLFTDTTAGFSEWNETQTNVQVQRGTFHVGLGSVNPIPSIFNAPLFVQVTAQAGPGISSAIIFSPRTPLSSAAYALSLRLPFTAATSQSFPTFNIFNYGTGSAINGSNYYGPSGGTGVSGYSFGGFGVSGFSPYGTGLSGTTMTNNTNTSQFGVYGLKNNSLGLGIFGGTAILGESDSSFGVSGLSQTSGGVLGFTYDGYGVFGQAFGSGYGVYSWGPLAVTAASGDASVQFPNDAINSQEILDEPGVAAKYYTDNFGFYSFANVLGTNQRVDSLTITSPGAGKIIVQTSGYINVDHSNGTDDNIGINVMSDPNGSMFTSGVSSFEIPLQNPSSFNERLPFANLAIFDAPSGGAYKFYLIVNQFSGANLTSNNVAHSSMVATYYPTTYGSTPIVVPGIASKGQDGSPSTAHTANTISYQTAGEYKAAKTRDLNQKVMDLEAQVKNLEKVVGRLTSGKQ